MITTIIIIIIRSSNSNSNSSEITTNHNDNNDDSNNSNNNGEWGSGGRSVFSAVRGRRAKSFGSKLPALGESRTLTVGT